MENKEPVCQSCCMPLDKPELCGTEADGTRSKHYCVRCYKDGAFTQPDATLETILDISAKVWAEKDPTIMCDVWELMTGKEHPLATQVKTQTKNSFYGGHHNTWTDPGEVPMETESEKAKIYPKVSPRTRPTFKMKEVKCSKCGKIEEVHPDIYVPSMQEGYRCNDCY